ncbi:MAG: efflux RND transporter permease subunit, partial [Desulfuromonadales bacterium]|nr:efflux RND transporter permease subunit [Desulfuromonadales bacterium]
FIQSLQDIENTVIKVAGGVPVYVKNVARVITGPALRRGALDKEGAEVVGGVAVVRYGDNPLKTIKNIKRKIEEISSGLPSKRLPDGTLSQVRIVPFYDRSGLIRETLGTLNTALFLEIMVTIIVVLIMMMHLRSSLLISATVPLAVLLCFIAMKSFGVDANVVALSGIAIAIGTIVDVGIVICENILRKLDEAGPEANRLEVIYDAAVEVGSAVMTAVATTVVSFLPVFTMQAAEGKLFKPLAFTKTFTLIGSILVALTIIPPAAPLLFRKGIGKGRLQKMIPVVLIVLGVISGIGLKWWLGLLIALAGAYQLLKPQISPRLQEMANRLLVGLVAVIVTFRLAQYWLPLGTEKGDLLNFIFVGLLVGGLLGFFYLFMYFYEHILRWCLDAKLLFLMLPLLIVLLGGMIWLGADRVFGWLPYNLKTTAVFKNVSRKFPGLGKEFMPPLDEGSYLLMPTTMPHASIGECLDVLQKQDMAIRAIPEVDLVAGKIGRVESPLDPAPISMVETVI